MGIVPESNRAVLVAVVDCDDGAAKDPRDEPRKCSAAFESAEDVSDLLVCRHLDQAILLLFDHVAHVEISVT